MRVQGSWLPVLLLVFNPVSRCFKPQLVDTAAARAALTSLFKWLSLEAMAHAGGIEESRAAVGATSRCAYVQVLCSVAAGTKAAERAAAKAAKLQEQVDFEATFASMSEQEIALMAFRAKPPVVSQAKKKKLAKEEEARIKVQLQQATAAQQKGRALWSRQRKACCGTAEGIWTGLLPLTRVPQAESVDCLRA